jgi:GT2 family glycosyltransferase
MQVSFIIPLYNCLPLTQAMLASLRATLPAGLKHEIIFVDDGSTDGTRAWLASLASPCRAILNEKNLGFAGACNRGAATASGEFLFFLNNDLVLLPHWLEPMLAAFRRFHDTGLIGNVQLNAATGEVDHAGITFSLQGKPTHLSALPITTRWLGWPAHRAVPASTGACCALRRSLWSQLGGFDEGFINGGEDIDLCLRAGEAGWRNYIALRSVVRHHISSSIGRKLRDEPNTRRLHQRWREVIVPLIMRQS